MIVGFGPVLASCCSVHVLVDCRLTDADLFWSDYMGGVFVLVKKVNDLCDWRDQVCDGELKNEDNVQRRKDPRGKTEGINVAEIYVADITVFRASNAKVKIVCGFVITLDKE